MEEEEDADAGDIEADLGPEVEEEDMEIGGAPGIEEMASAASEVASESLKVVARSETAPGRLSSAQKQSERERPKSVTPKRRLQQLPVQQETYETTTVAGGAAPSSSSASASE